MDELMTDLVRVKVQLPFGSAEQFARFGPSWTDLWIREGTSDEDVLREVWIEDTYRVRGIDLTTQQDWSNGYFSNSTGNAPVAPDITKTVIDVGACTGIFSALCLAFGAAHVVAVEPEPENVELLRKNLRPWVDRGRVTVVACAVGDVLGAVFMHGSAGTAYTSRSTTEPNQVAVSMRTIAEIVGLAESPIALMKIDVEGAEFAALEACSSDVLARVERIHMEWHGVQEAPHLGADDGRYGRLLTKLARTHAVSVFGDPDVGGMLFAHSYTL